MSFIQWFIRLVKKDMGDYEVKAKERREIYRNVKEKLKTGNMTGERGEDGRITQRQSALPGLAKREGLGFYIKIHTRANIIWRFGI